MAHRKTRLTAAEPISEIDPSSMSPEFLFSFQYSPVMQQYNIGE